MSVPIAVVGWIPKIRIRSGVISEPPPMPVMPTSTPMPRPKMMIAGSTWCRAGELLIDFPDYFGQERAVRQDTKVPTEASDFAADAASPAGAGDPAGVAVRGLRHAYGELTTIEGLDLEAPGHRVLGIVGPSGCGKSTLLELI